MSACFSCSVFIIALVSFNEESNLRQVDVRVEIVNKPEGQDDIRGSEKG